MSVAPRVRYTRSDGLDIAYAVYGSESPDIVFVPGHMSHLDLNEEMPYYRPYIERLPAMGRTVFFDRRGSGLSDRSQIAIPEEEIDDLRSVMDSAGIANAHVIGTVDGGPITMLIAAMAPERVDSLVLYGTAARLLRSEDYPIGPEADFYENLAETYEAAWGTGEIWRAIVSDPPVNPQTDELLARWKRNLGTPKLMADHVRLWTRWDVRSALGLITCPTLVLYNRGDHVSPPEASRYLAAHIKGARLVELPFDCHVNWDGSSMEAACDAIEEFLTDSTPEVRHRERVLATVLFTDIVGSTDRAARLGDHRWRQLLSRHDSLVRRHLLRFRGREVKTTGDGFLATFDGPARAIRCARAIVEAVPGIDLQVRAGLHTGEIEEVGDDVGGIAVHIAARVLAHADAGEVMVSSSVPPLVVGSGIEFHDRGEHELRGVPGAWRLFAVKG
ncbi:MAG TPA: adenylate/guanylate cyclase domain-containing protein [Acidimicrobiales bacterium]|nr:adenylate/guanylate cyclase domain-containing protein [Acidimicrobiales bacterium]